MFTWFVHGCTSVAIPNMKLWSNMPKWCVDTNYIMIWTKQLYGALLQEANSCRQRSFDITHCIQMPISIHNLIQAST